MTVPSVSSSAVPSLTGGLFVVRVHCVGADSDKGGGLAVTNGIRTPNAQGKTGSAFIARLVAVSGNCANDEKVINEVARPTARDNEVDARRAKSLKECFIGCVWKLNFLR